MVGTLDADRQVMARKRRSSQRSDSADAFIRESEQTTGTQDDLAEHLAEEFTRSIATGEADDERVDDDLQPEEIGGPFIESAADREYGATRARTGPDPDSPPNPVPEAVGSLVVASPEEEQQAAEEAAERNEDVDQPPADAERPSQMLGDRDALSEASATERR